MSGPMPWESDPEVGSNFWDADPEVGGGSIAAIEATTPSWAADRLARRTGPNSAPASIDAVSARRTPDLPLPPVSFVPNDSDTGFAPETPLSLRQTRQDQGIAALGRVPTRADLVMDTASAPLDMLPPETFGGQAVTYGQATPMERAGEQLRSGFESMRQGGQGATIAAIMRDLEAADRADAGMPAATDRMGRPVDGIPWNDLTPEQRASQRQGLERALGERIQAFIASRRRQGEMIRNPNIEPMAAAADAGNWGEVWRILRSDPGGILQQLSVESAPHMIPGVLGAMSGGVVGAAVGSRIGQFLGSYAGDAGPRMVEAVSERMQQAGVDMADEAAVDAWLRSNGPAIQEALRGAQRGAFGPALADAATLGLARPLTRGAGLGRNARRAAGNLGIELGLEGTGEAAAGVLTDGQVKPSEVLMEMLGAGPQAVASTGIATIFPGDAAPERVQGQARIPYTRSPEELGPPAPGQLPQDYRFGPSAPGQGAAAVPPAASPEAGQAAAGATPANPPPTAPDAPPDIEVTTTAPAPGSISTVRPSLEAALNNPEDPMAERERLRLEAERAQREAEQAAAAEEARLAQRAAAIERIQGELPPGWRVVDEGGVISVLDPNGDWQSQMENPPRDEEGEGELLRGMSAIHQEGQRTGIYPAPPAAPPSVQEVLDGSENIAGTPATSGAGVTQGDAPPPTETAASDEPTTPAPRPDAEQRQERAALARRMRAVAAGFASLGDKATAAAARRAALGRDNGGPLTAGQVEAMERELEQERAAAASKPPAPVPQPRPATPIKPRDEQQQPDMLGGNPKSRDDLDTEGMDNITLDGERDRDNPDAEPEGTLGAPSNLPFADMTPAEALAEFRRYSPEEQADAIAELEAELGLARLKGLPRARFNRLLAAMKAAATPADAPQGQTGGSEGGDQGGDAAGPPPLGEGMTPAGMRDWMRRLDADETGAQPLPASGAGTPRPPLAGGRPARPEPTPARLRELADLREARGDTAKAEDFRRTADEWERAIAAPTSQPPALNVATPAPSLGPAARPPASATPTPAPDAPPAAPASDLEARKAAAKAKFAAAIRAAGQRTNAGIDPSVLSAGIELGLIYIEEGVVKFRAWARAVLNDAVEMGLDPEAVKPVLKPVYLATSAEVADDVADQMDDRAAVRAFDLATLDQPEGGTDADGTGGSDAASGGTPAPAGSRTDAQSGDAPADPEVVGDGAPSDVVPPEGAEPDGDDGVPGAAPNVGGTRPPAGGGNADNGRPRDSGTGAPDAGAGTGAGSPTGAGSLGGLGTPAPAAASAGDFHIDDPAAFLGGGAVARFNRNRTAIETLNAIRDSDRPATREEQAKLAAYTGWGSFGQDLFKGSWDNPDPRPGWEERDRWLREHLGRQAWESAQASILNAHYTDPPIVLAMWDMVRRAGFEGGRVLEPSMGTGNFFSLMPLDLKARSDLTGIELDTTTAEIAKLLFPASNVQQKSYQDSRTPDDFYDVVIGNWPFAGQTVADRRHGKLKPTLHDFFFLKALDQVRPGGLVIGITSNGTMDKEGQRVRAHLARNAELVTAIRLPSGAFEGYAGTAVVTDIVVLKKRATPLLETPDEAWVKASMVPTPAGPEVRLNGYFQANPDRVLGIVNHGSGTTRGSAGLIVDRPANLMERLTAAVALVPEGTYERERKNDGIAYITNHTDDREGALVFQGDQPFVVRGEQLAPAGQVLSYSVKNAKETAARVEQMRELVAMRRAYAELITKERAGQDAEAERAALRGLFQAFERAHGKLRDSFGMRYLDKIDDPFFPALAALVQKDGTPAAILSRSTMRARPRPENPSIPDAFVLARQQSIRPTLGEIAALTGKTTDEVKAALIKSGAVFETATGDIEPSDLYLSGNVRQKLRQAMAAVAAGQTQMQRNVDALKAVQPKDVPYYDIEVQFGATWVPEDVYEAYVAHMLNKPDTEGITIRFTLGRWKARLAGLNRLSAARSGFGMDDPRVPFSRLLQAAMSNQTFKVMVPATRDSPAYVDQKATAQAAEKIASIRSSFGEWLWKDPERRVMLEESYNETRNSHATPKYDGSFMAFEGMALSLGRGEFQLREHQVNAIWRAVLNRKSINAHEVGTGKTFTMGGIAVESRRYGIAKKPLILAHNANSKAVATEIQAMYPAAKVLYIDNLDPKTIEVQLRRIANDDWDAVVLPHSQIDRLALSRETLMEIAKEEIEALEQAAIEAAQEDDVDLDISQMDDIRSGDKKAAGKLRSPTAKDLVRARNAVLNKIDALAIRASREKAVQFENLGIDMILVDEAHEFKKPPIVTGMKMKGLQTGTSDKAIALNFLTSYVRRQNNGNNVHTFTGTPITNTLVEIFHQMRFVMLEEMKAAGVDTWDAWFGSFAREVQDVELSAAGEYEPITRLAAFINVPELRRLVGQYLDVVFGDDMPEMQPRQTKSGKTMASPDLTEAERVELENGRTENAADRPYKKVINITSEMTERQTGLFEEFQADSRRFRSASGNDRREMMRSGDPASPIIVEGGANLASFDERMYDRNRLRDSELAGQEGTAPLDPRSKVAQVVKNVLEVYRSDDRANQVIFADQGYNDRAERAVPETDPKRYVTVKTFSAINDLIKRLVAEGIPREQIALVTGGTSAEKKFEISQAMNEGRLRVVIGLSSTLGVGVNMQRNLRAMHHMDAPYMPGDLEQRNGRGWRQGNQWNTVLEYRYITDRLDGRRWQILAIKQRFILAFMRDNNSASRIIEGEAAADAPSDFVESFAEAAGDPRGLIREQMKRKLDSLNQAERMHGQAIADSKRMLNEQLSERKRVADLIAASEAAQTGRKIAAFIEATKGDGFNAVIGGTAVTTRAEATEQINKIAGDMRQGEASRPAGTFGGVKITMQWLRLAERPQIDMTIGDADYSGASIASLEAKIRQFPELEQRRAARLAEHDANIERLREVIAAPFNRAAQLKQAKQALADLEADLAANPVAPPGWLRIGTPREGTVFWRGKPFTVTGHRWNKDGWFVLADDERGSVVIPYMEATDQQGIPAYEERPFTPPVVVDARGGRQQAAAPATKPDDDLTIDLSAPAGWGEVGDGPAVDPITPDAMRALLAVLRKLAGGQAVLEISASGLGTARGAAGGPLVRLAYSIGKESAERVVRHEAIHTLRNLGKITDAEWSILTEAAKREGWAVRFDIEDRYRKLYAGRVGSDGKTAGGRTVDDLLAEEAVAEAFAQWATGNAPQTSGAVARIFQKIRQFLVRLRNAMRGRGFRDEASIFGAITRGEVGARQARQNPRLRGVPDARRSMNRAFGGDAVVDADTPEGDIPAWLGGREDEMWAGVAADWEGDMMFSLPGSTREMRATEEPKRTVTAYKLFRRGRDGGLYPLFIGAKKAVPVGEWVAAEHIPTKGFAERPGWHAGVLPTAPHLRTKQNQRAPDRVWAEVEMPADRDWQGEADASRTRDIRDRVPDGGFYRFRTNKMQGGAWLIGGALKVNKILADADVRRILEAAGESEDDIAAEAAPATNDLAGRLSANPLDPALFRRLLGAPAWQAVLKASTALREENIGVVRRLWRGTPVPDGVDVTERAASQDILPILSRFRLPTRMFAEVPELGALVERGIVAERRMARWSKVMNDQLDAILGQLKKDKGDREKVTQALLDADAEGVKIEDAAIAAAHYAGHGLSPAEAKAAAAINRMLVKNARLVDQHRRAMMPKVLAEKARLWQQMATLFDRGPVEAEGYAVAYRRRAYLNRRIREGKGDLKAQAAEVEKINADLRAMRFADPEKQERMARLREQYDLLEARLVATSVRRKDGYFPHKFYGSWRLFEVTDEMDEDGEPVRIEVTSDQGFYNTRDQAVAAARAYLAQNPGARLAVEPKLVTFPASGGGAILSAAQYRRLKRGLEQQAGIEGEELQAALSGVARREGRRRTFAPGMKRTGAEGFAEDLDRVMRTHFAQTVRYVEMDKMKFRYVSQMERLGLAPVARSTKVTGDDTRAELERTMQAWWRDLNGAPQPGEAVLDRLIASLPLPGATLGAMALTLGIGAAATNPVIGAALAGYTGLRLYRAATKNPHFVTRQMMGDISSDLAHLKLGMFTNVASAVVNLSQTAVNTYPVLGEKWAAVGIARAIPALWSLNRNAGTRGRMSSDAILLERAGVRSNFSVTADSPAAMVEDRGIMEGLKKLSMLAFTTAEQMNRATAFLGALARAEAAGKMPGPAFQEAIAVMGRTQFEGGVATRPEILRSHVLRLPTQFKNFMAQQLGFVFGLRGAEIPRFLLSLTLVAGVMGLVLLPMLTGLIDAMFDWDPLDWLRDKIIREGAEGSLMGTAADVLARGLPSLLGIDISGRVGMGVGFVPESPSDMTGPFISTIARMNQLSQNNARVTDYLNALSPATNPLRVAEAAANGASITSEAFWAGGVFGDGRSLMRQPTKRGQIAYEPTNTELVAQGLGFRPLRAALLNDARQIEADAAKDRRRDVNAYLARIIDARRNMPNPDIDTPQAEAIRERQREKIRATIQEARANGVRLTATQINEAVRNAQRTQAERDARNAPREQRRDMRDRQRAIDARAQ